MAAKLTSSTLGKSNHAFNVVAKDLKEAAETVAVEKDKNEQ
jgi:hypothetical protein